MWKQANRPTSGIHNSRGSSTTTTTVPSTAKNSPQRPPSTPPTPFLASKSEIRFALDSDFGFDSEGQKRVPPELPIEPTVVAQPNTPANPTPFSPIPNQCYRIGASNLRFSTNPNNCYRLAPPRRRIHLATRPNEREDGASIPLRGQYVTVRDDDDDGGIDIKEDDDEGDEEGNWESENASLGLNDDLVTGVRKFAWAYAKGLGGLVMGVVDGLARGSGGEGVRGVY